MSNVFKPKNEQIKKEIKKLWTEYGVQNHLDYKSVSEEFANKSIIGKFEDAQDWLVKEIAWRLGLSCESVEIAVKGIK